MPFTPILTIIVGLLVAFMLPEFITIRDKDNRNFIKRVILIIGILILISGIIKFISSF